jgi:hypothetical protein
MYNRKYYRLEREEERKEIEKKEIESNKINIEYSVVKI